MTETPPPNGLENGDLVVGVLEFGFDRLGLLAPLATRRLPPAQHQENKLSGPSWLCSVAASAPRSKRKTPRTTMSKRIVRWYGLCSHNASEEPNVSMATP